MDIGMRTCMHDVSGMVSMLCMCSCTGRQCVSAWQAPCLPQHVVCHDDILSSVNDGVVTNILAVYSEAF